MDTLLFIYNADNGFGNALLDFGRKYIQPSSYDCQLCMLSYGPLGVKKEWEQFIGTLPFKTVFLHRNEFLEQYTHIDVSLPAVVQLKENNGYRILIDATEFKRIDSLESLIDKIIQVTK